MEYASLTRTTHPAVEPVSLSEAKSHCRVDSEADDSYIVSLIQAAREWVEAYLDRTLVHTQWTMRLDEFPADDEIELPRPPMATAAGRTAVTITYTLADGSTETLSTSLSTPGEINTIYAGTWPSIRRDDENAVSVTWWAGYGDSGASVPAAIRHAMLMLVGYWYDNRSAVLVGSISKELEFAVSSLLDSQRWGAYR